MSVYYNYNQQKNKELPQRYKENRNLIELHRMVMENINKRKEEEEYVKEIEDSIKRLLEDMLK